MKYKKCMGCVASLVCVSGAVDMIYRCNDCSKTIIQLKVYQYRSGHMPEEIRVRKKCPRWPYPSKVQNAFMMCQHCAGVVK
jgi:hypothetical protein